MIQRSDILSIPYLKKSAFTGSFQGMRYRLERVTEEEREALRVVIWPEPYCFAATNEAEKESREFPFSEEGICQTVEWLNACWQQQEERWHKAKSHW